MGVKLKVAAMASDVVVYHSYYYMLSMVYRMERVDFVTVTPIIIEVIAKWSKHRHE